MASTKSSILFGISLMLLAACKHHEAPAGSASVSQAPTPAANTSQASDPAAPAANQSVPSEQRLRQIIRKAELSFDVASPADALREVTDIAERHGGFVANSSSTAADERTLVPESVTCTLRVPSNRFSAVLNEVRKLSRGSAREHIGSQDVSEEYVDLEARIKTQRALEQQFLEILKRADKVEDALRVEREIATVRAEVEKMEGRRRLIEREVDLSTITLTFTKQAPLVTSSWRDLWDAVRQAYADSIDNTVALLVMGVRSVGNLLPAFVLVGLPGFWIMRRLLRSRRLKAKPPQMPEPTPTGAQ
ncbi:MAG: DUF4349 domain-containing protein [Myxococcota bacterium]